MTGIETALFARLITIMPPGTAVFLHEMPQDATGPYVVFEVTERSDVRGTAPLSTLEVRVACYAPVHADSELLARLAREGLEFWSSGAPGLILHPLAFAGQEGGFESEFGVYRSAVTFAAQAVQWAIV